LKVVSDAPHDLWCGKSCERFNYGNIRHAVKREGREIERRRIKHSEIELIETVEARREQRRSFAKTIVENTHAAANHHLRRARRRRVRITTDARATRRPRKEESRREVVIAADVGLLLVTHSHRERQVWTKAPLILKKRAEIRLPNACFRIATRDRKLRRTAAELAHVWIALKEQGA